MPVHKASFSPESSRMMWNADIESRTCSNDEMVEDEMLGFKVYLKTRVGQKQIDGSPTTITEEWHAPALNCYPLKRLLYKAEKDGSRGSLLTSYEVREAYLGKSKHAGVFDIPDLPELTPGEMAIGYQRVVSGRPMSPSVKNGPAKLDAALELAKRRKEAERAGKPVPQK